MFKKIIFYSTILGALTFQNCKPTEEDPEPTPITAPEIMVPSHIKNVDGILVSIITASKEASTETKIGTAYAAFYKGQNSSIKLDATSVKINSKVTTKSDDNVYFYDISATEPLGLDFKSQINWQVTGNTTTGVPVISNNDGSGFPNVPSLPEFINMNPDQDKLINWSSSFGADSVVFTVKGPLSTFKRVFNNTVNSFTIPKAEITKLGIGNGSLQIICYKVEPKTFGSKNYAFIKECISICKKVNITL
ncbi:MAG: hypothetical protein ACKVQB_13280 [Bacteroidia bacterium]